MGNRMDVCSYHSDSGVPALPEDHHVVQTEQPLIDEGNPVSTSYPAAAQGVTAPESQIYIPDAYVTAIAFHRLDATRHENPSERKLGRLYSSVHVATIPTGVEAYGSKFSFHGGHRRNRIFRQLAELPEFIPPSRL
jgi:hypothetical protein